MGFFSSHEPGITVEADPLALKKDGSNSPAASMNWGAQALTNVAAFDATSAQISGLTASRAMATDGSSNLASSATTATELGYLSGVTSGIQGQLDAKAADGANADITSMSGVTGSLSKPTDIEFVEGSAPSTPGTGDWKLYFKADGAYQIDDAGVETSLAGGGGGATTELDNLGTTAINANLNLNAGIDILPQGGGSTLGDSTQAFASLYVGALNNGPNNVVNISGLDFTHNGEVFFAGNSKHLRFTGTGINVGRNSTSQRPEAAYIERTFEVGRNNSSGDTAARILNQKTTGDPSLLYLQNNDSSATASALTFQNGRGTNTTPASSQSGDPLGYIIIRGFNGTSPADSGSVEFFATAGPVSGKIPGEMRFRTTNSSGTKATRMTLTDGGNLRVTGDLGVGNSAAATTPGSVVKKIEIFDASGTSLGFIAVYDSIT